MTETKNTGRVKKINSLYVGLIIAIIVGGLAAGSVYFILRFCTNFVIENYYADAESKKGREEEYVRQLQKFITEEEMTSDDQAKITQWALNNRYVYLMIYKDSELIFSSDMVAPGDDPSDITQGITGGITVEYPKREELIEYAEANGLYPINVEDGILFASIAEFTEYLYYDILNLVCLGLALLVLAIVILNYFRRIIARIQRLAGDVTAVSDGDMNHPILAEGDDELSKLSSDVENMRTSILRNIERERKAMDANTELITSISHDIRTPLTVLLGYIDMMKSHAEGDDVMRGYLNASEKTAMRLKHLSDDMFKYSLAFGNPEEGIQLEDYDAMTLIEQMLSEHILLLEESGYQVLFDSSRLAFPDGTTLRTDAKYLMRIMDNIFQNLTKYADVEHPIRISVTRSRELVEFTVINRVSKDADKVESTGIGLKTCSRLAEIIAEGFEYIKGSDSFCATLTLRATVPKPEEAEGEEKRSNPHKKQRPAQQKQKGGEKEKK